MTVHNNDTTIQTLLDDLNPEQREAVLQTDGPVLVLAGAGSGKTRVLTFRIAHLIASKTAQPGDILAMTFTNKAAGEMRERVEQLVPTSIRGMWVGTFHSLFARLLRREADRIGYDHNFTIYDTNDQLALVKMILKDLKISLQNSSPKAINHKISNAKNSMLDPQQYELDANHPDKELIAQVYKVYEKRLKENNAMDFDDLLIKPIELFTTYPLVKEYYQDRFKYILVDEYQDTNRAQYQVLKLLAEKHKNICVVGDDDQSIYRWRGAELRNILDFEKDYPQCKKFRLEQNYRSTTSILGLAHSVVKRNMERHPKKLWTLKEGGQPVSMITVYNEREESQTIVEKISQELRQNGRSFFDFAVLYRINAQSRVLEDSFRLEGIPYMIIGGVRFYERKEIKDILAYLQVLVNPADSVSLRRIINYPARGIGESTLARLDAFARDKNITLYQALAKAHSVPQLQSRAQERIYELYEFLEKYRSLLTEISPSELSSSFVHELGIIKHFDEQGTVEAASRIENVRELLQAIAEYTENAGDEASLEDYLQQISLITDIDKWDERANAVTLMTLHAAKGLEFPVVFMAGLEEGLFPLSRSIDDPHALEEERRLFYVGATRAKDKLYLFWSRNRKRYGQNRSYKSRFLKEIDMQFVTAEDKCVLETPRTQQKWSGEGYQDTMPDYENESQEQFELTIGARVRHFKFGKGTILDINSGASGTKLVINFDSFGKKRLVLPYAKLEIL